MLNKESNHFIINNNDAYARGTNISISTINKTDNYFTTISATKFPLLTTQDKDKAYYYRD